MGKDKNGVNDEQVPESPVAGGARAVEKAERKLKEARQSLKEIIREARKNEDSGDKGIAAAERLLARKG